MTPGVPGQRPDSDVAPQTAIADDTERPPRPPAVELAAAILIVSGVLGLIGTLGAIPSLPEGGGLFVAITAALNLGSVILGVLARTGRAWLVAVNYAAVLGFLDLAGAAGSGLSLLLGVADVIVVVVLLLNKPWFDAVRAWRGRRTSEQRLPSRPVGG